MKIQSGLNVVSAFFLDILGNAVVGWLDSAQRYRVFLCVCGSVGRLPGHAPRHDEGHREIHGHARQQISITLICMKVPDAS